MDKDQTTPKQEETEVFNSAAVAQRAEPPQAVFEQEAEPFEKVSKEAPTDNAGPKETSLPGRDEPPPLYESNKNKYLVIGLAAVFFVFLFFTIFKFFVGMTAKSKKITLTYWGLWEDESYLNPEIQEYQRLNPNIKINYKKMDPINYRQKLLARDEKVADRPDIFRFHNTWIYSIQEVISPLPKKIMSDEEYEKTFYPITKKDLKIDQFYYGMPLSIDGLVLIYNNKLFKAAGIDKAPSTWEEVVDYASRLTVKDTQGKIVTSGIALGTANNVEHFSDIFGWMLLQNGADIKKLSSAEAVDALDAYVGFSEPPNNVWDQTMPNSISAFTQEKVAMIFAPTWEILNITKNNPDLDIKVASLPVVPGQEPVALANYWVEGVSKYSVNQLEAWKFLKFLVEKETLEKIYSESVKSRLFGEAYSRVDLGPKLIQNEYIGQIIAQAKYMKSIAMISRTYDEGINDKIIKYIEDAINARNQGLSSQEALNTVNAGVEQISKLYGIK